MNTTTTTNPAAMLSGSNQSASRIDTGTALVVGAALIVGMICVGHRYMRSKQRQAEAERDGQEFLRRASDKTIAAGLVGRR